jgi:hypothetical protein
MKFTDETVHKILLGTRAFRVVDFPGRPEVKVAVRVLSEAELMHTRVQAQDDLRKLAKRRHWSDLVAAVDLDPSLFDRFATRALVFWAFYDPDTIQEKEPKRFFMVPDEVESLDTTTVTQLCDAYAEHAALVTPLRQVTEDQVREIVEALGKAQIGPEVFSGFDRTSLQNLCTSMARVLRKTAPSV